MLFHQGPVSLGWFPGCLFHRLTGWHCPGCGMTRATCAALHGNIREAFRFNPLGMLVLPVVLVLAGLWMWAWVWGRPPLFCLKMDRRVMVWLVGLVIAYWFLRNLPYWPLTLLAPP
ncbi:MAG: DUF2752 domain-containing protein [Gloeobacteraceae cyanobacterium ES-bin-144]|nr:DUF2752 domain-containing protein [Verrucomicrobiales bacterium]